MSSDVASCPQLKTTGIDNNPLSQDIFLPGLSRVRVGSPWGDLESTSPSHHTNTLAPSPQPHASPVSPRTLGAREGWPGLLMVPAVPEGPGMPAVGVPLAGTSPEGVAHVQEGS